MCWLLRKLRNPTYKTTWELLLSPQKRRTQKAHKPFEPKALKLGLFQRRIVNNRRWRM